MKRKKSMQQKTHPSLTLADFKHAVPLLAARKYNTKANSDPHKLNILQCTVCFKTAKEYNKNCNLGNRVQKKKKKERMCNFNTCSLGIG